MNRTPSKRRQCQIRFYPDEWEKIQAKTVIDRVTYQKVGEILFRLWLKNDPDIMRHIKKYADDKYSRKRRHSFDEMEAEEIFRHIKSPLQDEIHEAISDLEKEDEHEE